MVQDPLTSEVEKLEGVDAYRFEFVNDKIHERLGSAHEL